MSRPEQENSSFGLVDQRRVFLSRFPGKDATKREQAPSNSDLSVQVEVY